VKRGALAAAALLASASHVGAAPAAGSGVGLTLSDCPGLDERALRELLQLELVTLQLEHVDAGLLVRCDQGRANIELSGADGRYPVEVRVELRDTAKAARERLVALAATELLAQAERARVGDEGATRHVESRQAAPEDAQRETGQAALGRRPRSVELFVAGSLALDGTPKTTLWGGSLGTLIGLGQGWSLLFDTRFERGVADVARANVRWSVLSGFAGPTFHVDAARLRVATGLGLRAGWLAFDAAASPQYEVRSLTAPWAGVALPLRLSTALAGRVVPFVGLELGYVLLPVQGDVELWPTSTAVLVEQRGPWFSSSAGLGVAL
jgi:hypothetical protein